MDINVLNKRMHKLLAVAIMMVMVILIMAFVFINHADNSLNKATYTTMNQEMDLCAQRISAQKDADLTLLKVLSKELIYDSDVDTLLMRMKEENDFTSILYIDINNNMHVSSGDMHITYNDLSKDLKNGISKGFSGKNSTSIQMNKNRLIVTYTVPVYDNSNHIMGVLCANGSLTPYSLLLKKSINGGNLYITNLKDFYGIQKDEDSNDVLAVLKHVDISEKINGLIGVNGDEHGIVVKSMGIHGWYICYVNSAKSLNNPIYMMSRATNFVLVVFVLVVILLFYIAYRIMEKNHKEMENIAYTDRLTEAVSTIRFMELVETYDGNNHQYSLVALNMRRFKFMNEILGRRKSDEILRRIVACIKPMLKKDEIICRDSADVFYILLTDTKEIEISNRINAMFDEIRKNTKDFQYEYEFCCGVISNVTDEEKYSYEQMLTNVMFALAQSKEMSSGNICFFDEEVHKKKEFENFVESNMQQALDSERFEMVLQPKIDLNTNKVFAAEALVRWKLDNGTYLPPSSFVGLFEKNRFCSKLDFYMLRKAFTQIREWMDMGIEPVNISVNQSKIVFYHENYISELKALLNEYQVSAKYITLEVLESTVIEDIQMFNQILTEVKKLGFSVSLDDFGSGYSSLNVLSQLHIDELKIDRIFLHTNSEMENQKTKWILESIISFAKKSHILVVVEGVESSEDDVFILELKADIGQGYFYGRPLSICAFSDLICAK